MVGLVGPPHGGIFIPNLTEIAKPRFVCVCVCAPSTRRRGHAHSSSDIKNFFALPESRERAVPPGDQGLIARMPLETGSKNG